MILCPLETLTLHSAHWPYRCVTTSGRWIWNSFQVLSLPVQFPSLQCLTCSLAFSSVSLGSSLTNLRWPGTHCCSPGWFNLPIAPNCWMYRHVPLRLNSPFFVFVSLTQGLTVCTPGWPQTPVSAFLVLGLKVWPTTLWIHLLNFCMLLGNIYVGSLYFYMGSRDWTQIARPAQQVTSPAEPAG